jgi:hypothetical protein
MKNLVLGISVLLMAFSLTGCNYNDNYYGGGYDPYAQPWYDVYGYYCGSGNPSPGCNFYADGQKVADYEDPYYYSSSYTLYYDYWAYTDSYGYSSSYYGWAWLSPDGVLYDEYGYALNESHDDQGGRDLIGDVAQAETQVVTEAGKGFADKYALSEDTGIRVARTLNDWATLGKKRGRTEQDVADFSQRLYGVSLDKAKAALNMAKTGDLSGVESVNTDIAKYWSTDPETSKEILEGWYSKQLSDAGIR